jgi:hypothetical protein
MSKKQQVQQERGLECLDDSRCGNCHYWKTSENRKTGECHRHVPRAISSENRIRTNWVTTHDDDFCGDHAPGTPRIGKMPKVRVF